jgi:hypothetical protein
MTHLTLLIVFTYLVTKCSNSHSRQMLFVVFTVVVEAKFSFCARCSHVGIVVAYRHLLLTLALNGYEWSLHFKGKSPLTHWLRGWVDPRARLHSSGKRKSLAPAGNWTRILRSCSQKPSHCTECAVPASVRFRGGITTRLNNSSHKLTLLQNFVKRMCKHSR